MTPLIAKPMFRAFLLKQELRLLYALEDSALAPAHLDAWLAWASRSRLTPFFKLARTTYPTPPRRHPRRDPPRLSNGRPEGWCWSGQPTAASPYYERHATGPTAAVAPVRPAQRLSMLESTVVERRLELLDHEALARLGDGVARQRECRDPEVPGQLGVRRVVCRARVQSLP